jgi:uncharacterized protein (DUF433 family)
MAINQVLEKTIIQKRPDIQGGDACIGNRGVPVWVIVGYRLLGRNDERLLNMFDPPITRADLDAAWEYYQNNRDEIDAAIKDNETGDDEGE